MYRPCVNKHALTVHAALSLRVLKCCNRRLPSTYFPARVWTFLDYWGITNFCALNDPWRDGGVAFPGLKMRNNGPKLFA